MKTTIVYGNGEDACEISHSHSDRKILLAWKSTGYSRVPMSVMEAAKLRDALNRVLAPFENPSASGEFYLSMREEDGTSFHGRRISEGDLEEAIENLRSVFELDSLGLHFKHAQLWYGDACLRAKLYGEVAFCSWSYGGDGKVRYGTAFVTYQNRSE